VREERIVSVARRLWPAQDGRGFNAFDFLHACGSPLAALFYSSLFCPEFDELDGMVFLNGTIEDTEDVERVRSARRRHGDAAMTERSFNTIEVPDLFGGRSGEADPAEYRILAERLCLLWRATLQVRFPERSFAVEVVEPSATEDISVSFWQQTA
jgi:hypothetical protein